MVKCYEGKGSANYERDSFDRIGNPLKVINHLLSCKADVQLVLAPGHRRASTCREYDDRTCREQHYHPQIYREKDD